MTETLQDRLRQAADDNSDHPPIFGLYFEAADRIDELEQAAKTAKARAELEAERALRITGTVRTIGTVTTVDNPPWHTEPSYETFSGIVITASDDMLRAAGGLLYCPVDICPSQVRPDAAESTAR